MSVKLKATIIDSEKSLYEVHAYNRNIQFTMEDGKASLESKDFAVYNTNQEAGVEWLLNTLYYNGFITSKKATEVDYVALKRCYKYLEDCKLITNFAAVFPDKLQAECSTVICITVVDKVFLRKRKEFKVLQEHIRILVNASEAELKEKPYILMDADGHQYLTAERATYGGNFKGDGKGNPIYGLLTCKSANAAVKLGYIRYRLFFKDEATAIAAGYRPCGHCCLEKYKLWKEKNGK